jgi:NitT/TauT family transport system permease protein
MTELVRRWGLSFVSLAVVLGLWEVTCAAGWVSPVLLSAPSAIVAVGAEGLADGRWNADFATTLLSFALAFGVAALAGAGVGIAMGASRAVFHLVNPYVVALNALPKIVLCPLVMIWFGTGLGARVFMGALMAAFPVLTSTVTGVQSIDRQFVLLARAYGASRRKILWSVLLPSIAPYVLSGLRVGVNYAMVGVLIVELFSSSQGVGFRLNAYSQNFQVDLFFVLITLVAAFVLALSSLIRRTETRLGAWRDAAYR